MDFGTKEVNSSVVKYGLSYSIYGSIQRNNIHWYDNQ